jgi:hypothetical protein
VVIALLVTAGTEMQRPVTTALSVFDISASAAMSELAPASVTKPKPVKPTRPLPDAVPPPVVPTTNDMPVAMLEQANVSAKGGTCDLTGLVQTALQSSKTVRDALPQIPRDKRSVANAIMLWKFSWLADEDNLGATTMMMIRDVIVGAVVAAPQPCREQSQSGPRLLILEGVEENVVLAVGSGQWRWQDLVDSTLPTETEPEPWPAMDERIGRGLSALVASSRWPANSVRP